MPSERILILEDDEKLRATLVHVLSEEGYEVDQAGSGLEAIELASRTPYDLVIADIRMEGINGLEALARMKESHPELRSLVMTGYSTEEDSIRAIRLGVGDYLRKPFNLGELMDSVQRLLAARRQEQQSRAQEALLRRSLLRAVQAVARTHDLSSGTALERVGSLAGQLAAARNVAAAGQEEVQLAAWITALQRHDPATGLPDEEELTPSLRRTLRHVEECWDGSGLPDGLAGEQIPLESRLVSVALALAAGEPLGPGSVHDPELCLLADVTPTPAEGPAGEQLRTLLSLGQALEVAAQRYEATHAYQQIAQQPVPTREGVQAWLGLARLSGEPEEACRRALEMAQSVGPVVTAQSALEAGLLLLQRDIARGEPLLMQAGRLYRELQMPAHEALATVAVAALTSTPVAEERVLPALELLARAEHRDDVLRHQGWMADWLLSSHPGLQASQRILQRWLQDGVPTFMRLVEGQKLSHSARLALAANATRPELQALLARDPDPDVRAALSPAAAVPSTPVLRIYTLGPLEVFRGEERVPNSAWRSQKSRYLLAYLASLGGRSVSEDVLIDLFWPDDAEKGKRNLYWVTSILRGCLRAPGVADSVDYIARSQGMLALNPDLPRWHDLEEMEALFSAAAPLAGPERAERLRQGVSLYRGSFLEGCYMDWAESVRQRAFSAVCEALLGLAQWAQQANRPAESLEHAQRLSELDPCRQDACILAMQALLALGRAEEAVRSFERCRKALGRELEMEPGVPLLEMQQRALLSLSG